MEIGTRKQHHHHSLQTQPLWPSPLPPEHLLRALSSLESSVHSPTLIDNITGDETLETLQASFARLALFPAHPATPLPHPPLPEILRFHEYQNLSHRPPILGSTDSAFHPDPDGQSCASSSGLLRSRPNRLRFQCLRGHVLALAMDPHGCRFLQAELNHICQQADIDIIFSEVVGHLSTLMIHPFGNYLFQKLVEVCSPQQRTRILVSLARNEWQLVALCLDMHGTRSVQKLMDHLTSRHQISLLMSVLSRGVVRLSKDNSGHHVIKHCLECFPHEDNEFLLNEVTNNCYTIATDRSGCCLLQSCIEYSQAECRERLVAALTTNALLLTENYYGNYVVQYLLEMKIPWIVTNIVRQLKGNFVYLSCNKFASNVVEKCLRESIEERSEEIVIELLQSSRVPLLLNDPYGNYVIQTALSVSQGAIALALQNLVRLHYSAMRNSQYGKKILSWFEKRRMQHALTL